MLKPTLAVLCLAGVAHAEPRLEAEVGVMVGGHAFSDNIELGVADAASQPGPVSAGLFGARAAMAMPFESRLAAEAELEVIPTKDDMVGDRATVFGMRAHGRFDLLRGRMRPFVLAGLGAHVLSSTSPRMDNDADISLHWGLGASYAVRDAIDLRVDWRHLIVPGRTHDGAASDFELSFGITYHFGFPNPLSRPPRVVAPPPSPVTVVAKVPEPLRPAPVLEELGGISFEPSSAKIDISSLPILERAYQMLHDRPQISIEIAGHTSVEGDTDHNLDLSLRRAEAVRAYLVGHGIAADRILTVGHGAQVPIGDNHTEEGRRKNRRIEFRIVTSVE